MMNFLRFMLWLSLYTAATAINGAEGTALIKHKLMNEKNHDTDASVVVARVNNQPIIATADQTNVPAGEQSLEVECLVKLYVGMGTVDFSKVSRMDVKLEAGKTYQLGATLTAKGDCTPTIE